MLYYETESNDQNMISFTFSALQAYFFWCLIDTNSFTYSSKESERERNKRREKLPYVDMIENMTTLQNE